jgi:hypothetical protein
MIVSAAQVIPIYWQTSAGAAATGKVLGNLTYKITLNGVDAGITPTLTEGATVGAWRLYTLNLTAPATAGQLVIHLEPNDGVLSYDTISDDVTRYSADDVLSLATSPVIATLTSGGPSGDTTLRLVKSTYVPISFTVRDATGATVDLSGYNAADFSVRSQNQTTTTYSQTTGITMTSGGLVTIAVPENAGFYAALTTGVDAVELYWDFVADESADTAKTRCLARGRLQLLRTEQ